MVELGLKAIGHVALKVADIDRSLAFYRDTLGFAEMMRIPHPDHGGPWITYLRITDTQFLELFVGGEGASAPGPNATAINHFCLESHDLEATAVALHSLGVKLTVEPKTGADFNRQCWIEDPDGNRIEFMQLMPGCMQLEAIERLRDA